MVAESHNRDAGLSALASQQHGVVTLADLRAIGLSRDAIRHRVATGRLHRLHRGVYAVGHTALDDLAPTWAAVLACGSGSMASHHAAGRVLGLCNEPTPGAVVDVTVEGRGAHSRPGIRVHRIARLDARDRAVRSGIPLTTAARTLLDLAAVMPPNDLEDAYERARTLRLARPVDVLAAMTRSPGRRGATRLRALVQARPTLTRSAAERRLLDLIRRGGLPAPETNVRSAGHEVDLLWRRARLVVEVDGYAWHGGRAAFERDRRRDADLQLAGHRVIRVTWRRIVDEPEAVLVMLARVLG